MSVLLLILREAIAGGEVEGEGEGGEVAGEEEGKKVEVEGGEGEGEAEEEEGVEGEEKRRKYSKGKLCLQSQSRFLISLLIRSQARLPVEDQNQTTTAMMKRPSVELLRLKLRV